MADIGNLGSLRVSAEIPLRDWNRSYKKLTQDIKVFPTRTKAALDKAGKFWDKHNASIKKAALGFTAFGTAATAGLGFAVKTAAEFEQSMANTQSVIGATRGELSTLTRYARDMGRQSVFSARESADAMYHLGSAGMNTGQIMDSLKGTLDLAAATQSDLAFSSRTVAATLSAYGLRAAEAGRVSNIFAATISASQANMEKLSTSMGYVGPVAKSIGMSLEETAGILGSLYNAGLDASTAGTALRGSISRLLKPSDEAAETLKRLGIETTDSEGKLRRFTDIIRDMESSGLSAADALTIFGDRAGPAMLALVSQGARSIDDLTKKVTGTNKASEMAAIQVETFQGRMKLLKSATDELKITIGNALIPTLTDYTEKLTGIINKTSQWAEANPRLASGLVKVGGAASVTALGLGGIGLAAPGIISAGKALRFLATPVGALVALDAILVGWATKRIWSAAFKDVDVKAIQTKSLTKRQEQLQLALEQVGGALQVYEQSGDRLDATLGDLDISARRLNDAFGTNFTEATNAAYAYAALKRNYDNTTRSVDDFTGKNRELTGVLKAIFNPMQAVGNLLQGWKESARAAKDETAGLNNELLKLEGITDNGAFWFLRAFPDRAIPEHKPAKTDKRLKVMIDQARAEMDIVGAEVEKFKPIPLPITPDIGEIERMPLYDWAKGTKRIEERTEANNEYLASVEAADKAWAEATYNKFILDAKREAAEEKNEANRSRWLNGELGTLKILEMGWDDYGDSMLGVLSRLSQNHRVFSDTWIGTMTDWAIGNRRLMKTVEDLWSGSATSISSSALSIFAAGVDMINTIVDAQKEAARIESQERISDTQKWVDRGYTWREAAAIVAGELDPTGKGQSDPQASAIRRRYRNERTRTTALAKMFDRFGRPKGDINNLLGITRIPTASESMPSVPPPEPERFTPWRPEGTDQFGRPLGATAARMAPGRGDVTFGDIIINIPEGTDIRSLDAADWERIFRDNIQPAAESTGVRFMRSDALYAP